MSDNEGILNLPPLLFQAKYSIGMVDHLISPEKPVVVSRINKIKISSRIEEDVYILEDGQRVIITERKTLERPDEIDGVLKYNPEGKLIWISNKLVEVFQERFNKNSLRELSEEISSNWKGHFNFHSEQKDDDGSVIVKGLRPPQIGSLHAIGAHWSLHKQPATIVMPTGTGKTETMLSTLVAYSPGKVLVVVPSKILRDQTKNKFITLGLLRHLGNLYTEATNPIVATITKRPKRVEDLKILEDANVIIATMAVLSEQSAMQFANDIADRIDLLIVDEAHHIGANSWITFRENFKQKVLQFTATPYRRDGKLVDGKVIYEYPLHSAQQDGYFKKISFRPVYEIDPDDGDIIIAKQAIQQLKEDISEGKNHLMMVRCKNIARATCILSIYNEFGSEFNPVIIHSEEDESEEALNNLKSGNSKIVVCVNMLGEGFDLPELKIAAIHDTHKSLAVILQFTGRFTRTAGENIGDATVIANIADQDVSYALERLYSEDADWNQLLSEFSSEAARSHNALINFLNSSEKLDQSVEDEQIEISHHLLRPTLSTLFYKANSFRPKKFIEGIPKGIYIHRVWLHQESNTLYFVTRAEPHIRWTRSNKVKDRTWHLHVLHFNEDQNLLYLSSSDKSSKHEKIAKAVGATEIVSGDVIFRSLGNINRLLFQNLGLQKHGRRNLRYASYAGSDVATALSISERTGSIKSNLNGTGWENGRFISIGCSYKGRVWSREAGVIPELVEWCDGIGEKILDDSIDTRNIIANVLIPEEVTELPDKVILSIEWPIEILRQSEERVVIYNGDNEKSISMIDIELIKTDKETNTIEFCLRSDDELWGNYALTIGGAEVFKVRRTSTDPISITVGNISLPVEDYFSDYPPLIRFVDLSELDGDLLVRPQSTENIVFPEERFEVWDWSEVDITKESMWKDGAKRENTIQERVAQEFIEGGFDVVFDDDSSGEAADLICFKEEEDCIRFVLVHCKFTTAQSPGERVKDVVEVCSQAVRSAKWKWKFKNLGKHILEREKKASNGPRETRFLKGSKADINKFAKLMRLKELKPEIIIVQPGLSRSNHTPEQIAVLAAAYSYLKETIGVDLDLICSE